QAKVQAKNDAKTSLKRMASDLSKIVSGSPGTTHEQRIELGLSVRAKPSPLPPPGACAGFKVVLHADGSLQLSWKSDNPSGARGTVYEVWRRASGGGEEPSYVGTVGRKSIVDTAVPTGRTRVTYRVRGVRTTAVGPWAEHNVN